MSSRDDQYIYNDLGIVDPMTGEVIDEKIIDKSEQIRAFSYEEYVKKKHQEVYISEDDRRLMSILWRIGKELNVPDWIINEALWFIKKAKVLKTKTEFKNKPLYPFKEKYIYALYFVLTHKYGLLNIMFRIASMICNENGEQCYVSKKRGDKVFRHYLMSIRHFASYIYPNKARNPIALLDEIVFRYRLLPDVVHKRARDYAIKLKRLISGRKIQTIVATAIKLALDEIFPDKSNRIMLQICRLLNTSVPSVEKLIKIYRSMNSDAFHYLHNQNDYESSRS
ncbi:MAG: hypothetical protein QXK24_00430 [Ignisphaera sp.]